MLHFIYTFLYAVINMYVLPLCVISFVIPTIYLAPVFVLFMCYQFMTIHEQHKLGLHAVSIDINVFKSC